MKAALTAVQGVTDKKSTIPVLQNLLIESLGETEIRIFATNLDLAITKDTEASVETPGSICISARKLIGIVGSLSAGEIKFESEENHWVKMSCGRSKFRLAGVEKDMFPTCPKPKDMPITINGDVLADMVAKVGFAITNEQSRFTLSGAKFIVADGSVKLVSTDGHRLSYIEWTPDEGQPTIESAAMDTLVPKAALTEAAKMGQNGEVKIGEDINHIFFTSEGQMLSARKLTGQFPNYEMVLPKDNDKAVIIDGEEFKAAVRRVALMADSRNQSMKISIAPGEVRLNASSNEEGEGDETIDAEYGGEELLLGYNWHYLSEFLSIVKPEEKVVLMFKDSNSQTELKIAGNDGFRHIIMPLRVL